jgi:hypothetical protein
VTSMDDFDPPPGVDSLEHDLRAVYAAPVPALHFEPTLAGRPSVLERRPVRLGLGVAVVTGALVAAIVWLPAVGGGGTPPVNAQELIARSGQANASMPSVAPAYHMVSVVQLGKGTGGRTETWFNGASKRTESTDTNGGVETTFGMATTDADVWLYQTRDGRTLVAHVAHPDRSRDGSGTQSLADVLAGYTIPGCVAATITGETTIAGRTAYVIDVHPTPATCVADPSKPDTVKVAANLAEMGTATLSIDKATDVTLGVEQRDGAGEIAYSYRIETFETGTAAADAGLPFVPPSGAKVVEVADYSAAKSIIFEPDGSRTAPPTK